MEVGGSTGIGRSNSSSDLGQKVNPHGLRVGVIKDWDSKWYADAEFSDYLVEDYNIRKFLKKKLYSAGISKIEIERASDRVKVIIHTAKPGVVIGKGGAEIEYAPEFYEAKDDMGKVSKVITTEEEVTLKSGIMTWCGVTIEKLCQTARVTEKGGKRTVKIGGIGNATGKKYLLRFVHKDTEDGNIRITIVGNNQAGFTIAFAKDTETVIDAEFKAQPMDKEGTLILYEEDMDKTANEGGGASGEEVTE